MELSRLAPKFGARKRRKRIARGEGSGSGKTAGRGGKGQKGRKGVSIRPGFEGGQMPLYRRVPKLGFISRQRVFGTNQYNVVNLSVLDRFDNGAVVDVAALVALGYAKNSKRKAGLKILGTGNLTKKLTVRADAISASARQKIESLGGAVEIIAKPAAE